MKKKYLCNIQLKKRTGCFCVGGGVIILVILFLFLLGSREGFACNEYTTYDSVPSSTTGIYTDSACSSSKPGYNTLNYYTYYKPTTTTSRGGTSTVCTNYFSKIEPSSTTGIYTDSACSSSKPGYNTKKYYTYYMPTTTTR